MHPLTGHRGAVPVDGVHPARLPIGPEGLRGLLHQCSRGLEHPLWCLTVELNERGASMQHQASPLDPVADGGPVGAERMVRLVAVVVQQRVPLHIEMLRQCPVVVAGELVDRTGSDTDGSVEPHALTRDVGRCEQRLNGVHVRVDAAILLAVREGAVIGVHAHAGGFIEELLIEHLESFVE